MHRLMIIAGLVLALAGVFTISEPLQARVIDRPQKPSQWRTLTAFNVGSGATVPAGYNTIFTIPPRVPFIDREVLLGHRGSSVRYWGYCFPGDENNLENPPQSVGFPGKLFLSEAERAWRKEQEAKQSTINPLNPLPLIKRVLTETAFIRHQIDRMVGGMQCYIMSSKELPIGIDMDEDGLNTQLERQFKTDPRNPDTDGDGLDDFKEAILYGTDPNRRDTDSDGIIDGIEDANLNGRFDSGETSALKIDSDSDGLCDGYCRDTKTHRICDDKTGNSQECMHTSFGMPMGEDRNLNGKVDKGETDPRLPDSDNDGIRDDQEFFRCLLTKAKNC